MNRLDVDQICKAYGSRPVVDGLSFTAPGGSILGLLGPNGAGKTTAIRMIMGITAPDRGEIWFHSGGRRRPQAPKRRVGYLPEERGLYKEARVMDLLVFLAALKDVPKLEAQRRAAVWLEKFDLSGYAQAKVETLSKGMAQKVQFIAGILHQPEFVVLDEPFSGLDPVSQELFKAEIRALAAAGTTVLLSSHQMNIVEELCHQIFLIHRGRQVAYGSLREIKEQYGSYRVHYLAAAELHALNRSPFVADAVQTADDRWLLTLIEGATPAEFLSSVPSDADLRELSISRLSLHDIFVKVAQGGVEDEGNVDNSPMGNYA